MQILGKIFNALLFVSAMGGIFCVLSLFAARVLRCALPLWVPLCGMALFCVPILSPEVSLLSPERQDWLSGYRIACWIWAGGCGVFLLCDIVRAALAKRALKGYPRCNNERITAICAHCAQTIGLKKAPALYYGTLENPVCVTGAIRPALLMDKAIVERLNDTELSAVFFHELTHVKRRHLLWERIYDVVCLANWFNPFAWIARREFSLHCEMDCDDKALKASQGEMAQREYALAILRLLELSTIRATQPGRGAGALSFLLAKRRLKRITAKPSKIRERMLCAALAVSLALTVALSLRFSREHFYPYPAYSVGTEYSTGCGVRPFFQHYKTTIVVIWRFL